MPGDVELMDLCGRVRCHGDTHTWRFPVNISEGDDDDGETAAGDRLARLLELVVSKASVLIQFVH